MRPLDDLPIDFKLKDQNKEIAAGRYMTVHPFIKKYHISMDVYDEPTQERVTLLLICLVSATKKLFRNVNRYPTFDECLMCRNLFFNEDDVVFQLIQVQEVIEGQFFATLIRLK